MNQCFLSQTCDGLVATNPPGGDERGNAYIVLFPEELAIVS